MSFAYASIPQSIQFFAAELEEYPIKEQNRESSRKILGVFSMLLKNYKY